MKKNDPLFTRDVYIQIYRWIEVTREHDPSDQWSGEDTCTSWEIRGIHIKKQPEDFYSNYNISNREEPIDFDIKVGDWVYLVYAIYSTGDSFSYHENGEMEILGLFKDAEKAEACVKAYEGNAKYYISEGDQKMPIFRPWDGYFESLSGIRIESFPVRL